jgi:predicted ATPase
VALDPAGAGRRRPALGVLPARRDDARLLHLPRSQPGGRDPEFHKLSHGESFLEILRTRFDSPGLYCLDEPEAALSFTAQIALVATMHEMSQTGAQFVCATHSPLLAALPGAMLLEVGPWGLRPTTYRDLELVAHWSAYLAEPMRYLRHVL